MASSDGDTGRNNSPISVDAIEEVRVVLNNYQAEFGRNTGAQINIISKSGTREFHGSLASYFRRDELNANNYFNKLNNLPTPLYRYNTLSGTLGGPVLLPGMKRRDRLFFFWAREMWDADEPRAARSATMPTLSERQGDFSQTVDVNGRLIPVIDPLTGQPFPGNQIPASRINAHGQSILNLFPEPNFFNRAVSGGNYNYNDQDIATLKKTLDQVKFDANLSARDRLSVRWRRWRPITEAYSGVFAVNSNWNHFRNGYAQREDSVLVNQTHSFGSRIVNEASASYRYTAEVGPIPDTLDPMTRAARNLSGLPQLFPGVNGADIVPQGDLRRRAWNRPQSGLRPAVPDGWRRQPLGRCRQHLVGSRKPPAEGRRVLGVRQEQRRDRRKLLQRLLQLCQYGSEQPRKYRLRLRERAARELLELLGKQPPAVARGQRAVSRMVRPGFLEGHQQADARPRDPLLLGGTIPAA